MYMRFNCHKRAIYEFHKRTGFPPMRIIFFRDGLSEGEYALTGKEEIEDITGELVHRRPLLFLTVATRCDR